MTGEVPEPLVTLCYSPATALGLGPQLTSPILFCQYSLPSCECPLLLSSTPLLFYC